MAAMSELNIVKIQTIDLKRCNVRSETILVVTCDVRAVHFQAFEVQPQYHTIMKELT